MGKRLEGRRTLVVGGGQTPGSTVGNGRATAVLFAREGAEVVVADRELERAAATVDEIVAEGGKAWAVAADVTDESSIAHMVAFARSTMGGIDVLHNNVGVSLAGGDAVIGDIDMETFDRVTRINLTSMVVTCKHVLPIMEEQGGGVVLAVGSLASLIDYPYIAYKTSKAGVVAMIENIAVRYAPRGIRANAILPGLMETPMAIENRVGLDGRTREQVIAERDSHVPLRGKMGTGWDVAHAALWLASDDAGFVTGVALPVDGGQALVAG
ncbi:SDR family NAD(P)-dependent oxidoreductase [Pseudonocardia halophobica]|uniref:Short-chain dehydrogenase/reductase n=1 Tax=Pseudonocardia halophobica TaxID=29401 RepID=A0A9W6NV93_9PSEU|nr:SDR family NAD(P)-dependent oxidoreductase [Pseudonocardia halophobica]GLL10619.1 short-chain dehydrogenase/reductase [Pseudonocardia halophobica]